jgi:hypothetical protein
MGTPTIEPGPGATMLTYSPTLLLEWQYDCIYSPTPTSGRLYLIGYISYADESGIKRHVAFGREFMPATQRFRIIDDPNYEYGE